jgi:two-component system response regulator PhcR
MSGEAGAQGLYQTVRKLYVPLLEHGQWPAAPDWLPQLKPAGARTDEAPRAYCAQQARSTPREGRGPLLRTSHAGSDFAGEVPAILFVDDEPTSRKWFAPRVRRRIPRATAGGADEALNILRERSQEFGVLVTDYRMPERDGMKLLRAVQRDFRHVVRLLATAYAEKDVAIAAVNQGKVLRILEKPLDGEPTREALREALRCTAARPGAACQRGPGGRAARGARLPGARTEHAAGHRARLRRLGGGAHLPAAGATRRGASFSEDHPGELVRRWSAPSAARCTASRWCPPSCSRRATPIRSARRNRSPPAAWSAALLDEFPFEENERACVARTCSTTSAAGRRDLLYLVLCTLPRTRCWRCAAAGAAPVAGGGLRRAGAGPARLDPRADNGPGIPPEVLAKLTREPVTTRAGSGGSGMGLMFCQRVMQAISGSIEVQSDAWARAPR